MRCVLAPLMSFRLLGDTIHTRLDFMLITVSQLVNSIVVTILFGDY